MPNWCENRVTFDCSQEVFDAQIRPLISGKDQDGDDKAVTFNVLIPMPDAIYRGNLGAEEKYIYGKNNWYDWSCEHWGTKWDACNGSISGVEIRFSTAWCTPDSWYAALAEALDDIGVDAHVDYCVEGGDAGGIFLNEGTLKESDVTPEFVEEYGE